MSDHTIVAIVASALVGVFFVCGLSVGIKVGRESEQREAVLQGAAQWGADEYGRPVIEWKP